MTYKDIEMICARKNLPIAGTNEHGENIIIEHGCENWPCDERPWKRNFYKLTTAQSNGWTRLNFYFDDGTTEEFYERRS